MLYAVPVDYKVLLDMEEGMSTSSRKEGIGMVWGILTENNVLGILADKEKTS